MDLIRVKMNQCTTSWDLVKGQVLSLDICHMQLRNGQQCCSVINPRIGGLHAPQIPNTTTLTSKKGWTLITCIASGCILTPIGQKIFTHVCFRVCVLIRHHLSLSVQKFPTIKNKNIQMQKQRYGQLVEFDSRITFMHVTKSIEEALLGLWKCAQFFRVMHFKLMSHMHQQWSYI